MNFKKIQKFDSILFIGQSYFFNDRAQLYLIFEPLYYTLKRLGDTEKIVSRKSTGSLTEKYITLTTTDNSVCPSIRWYTNYNFGLVFKGSCLRYWLIGGFELARNTDPDKYVYTDYGIESDSSSELSFPDRSIGKKCHYFWSWYNLIICAYW